MDTSFIKTKPLWLIPLCFGLLVAGSGWWANHEVGRAIRTKLKEELQTALRANVTALEIWMQNQERMAGSLANDPNLAEMGALLVQTSVDKETDNQALQDLPEQKAFSTYLDQRIRDLNYLVGFLINTNGVIIGDSGRLKFLLGTAIREEHQLKYSQLFETSKPIVITPFKPGPPRPDFTRSESSQRWMERFRARRVEREFERPPESPEAPNPRERSRPNRFQNRSRDNTMMQVAAPLKNSKDEAIAALSLIINPEREFSKILTVASPGETGETYAFDAEGVMISRSRFEDQLRALKLIEDRPNSSAALNLRLRDPGGNLVEGFQPDSDDPSDWPLTRIVREAIQGIDGVDIQPFRDYRGIQVVGAWKWLPEYQFGVATKINAAEAYRPLNVLRSIFVVLFLLLLLASLILFVFSYSNLRLRKRFNEATLKAKQLGQYHLEQKIGEGGMGVVYKARHALMRRETAVKLLLPEKADPATIRRFEREVKLTCNLSHPNTIQVFDYGRTPDGIFYYAMEFLTGFNLLELVERFGPQPEGRVIHILSQVCDSLEEAHAEGLVHRDIKPANVFLCQRGRIPDMVKVLDFGLVGFHGGHTQDSVTQTTHHTIAGTPHFMAPEAFKMPDKADHRSDLYAVGAVGYFLLTGQFTYSGKTIFEIFDQQTSSRLESPTERIKTPLCARVNSAIMQCLEKNPDRRPQSASELKSALLTSEHAQSWTLERRRQWWDEHGLAAESSTSKESTSKSRMEEPTLHVDMERRFAD